MRRLLPILLFAVPALAATVRTDRPRILLGNGTSPGFSPAEVKRRCTMDAAYQSRCMGALTAGGGQYPAINQAMGYIVNGDAARCTSAYTAVQAAAADTEGMPDPHSFISNNQRVMLELAVVHDWCDPVLTTTQKGWLETKMVAWADWYSGARSGYPLDVWHDDMNNVWNSVALAGLALKGTAQDAKAQTYLSVADTQWKTVIFPALAYEADFWHEGFVYVQPALGAAIVYATAWTIATDEDLYAYARTSANDVFDGYLAMHAYLWRPDDKFAYFGDATDNKQSIELFTRPLIDMMTLGTHSPLGQGLSLEIKARARPGYDYSGADAYLLALFYDATKDATALARSTLPTARWLSPHAADVVVFRSGWSPGDTWMTVVCGDYFGSHQKMETGQFQIFKGAILTTSSGYYDNFDTDHWQTYFSQHSVHANTLAIYEPTEFFPTTNSIATPSANVNEGGQRPIRRSKNGTAYADPDLPTYLGHKSNVPYKDTGDVLAYEADGCHGYVACDLTAAYSSPGHLMNGNVAKVDEVTRQFVYLPPDTLVVFDRVNALDAGYEKRFLLQTPPSPAFDGGTAVLTNDGGVLWAQTLLPQNAAVSEYTNFTINGVAHPPSPGGVESFGTRLEIKPPAPSTRDYFLHVFTAGGAKPTATLAQDAQSATATITSGSSQWTLTFAKTGPLAGHLVAKSGGSTQCDLDLGGADAGMTDAGMGGAGGGSGTGGGSPAGGGSGTGGGSAASTGGGTSASGGGAQATGGGGGVSTMGCGCGAADVPALALLACASLLTRRRRA
jgi:hypothetical protein